MEASTPNEYGMRTRVPVVRASFFLSLSLSFFFFFSVFSSRENRLRGKQMRDAFSKCVTCNAKRCQEGYRVFAGTSSRMQIF